LTGSADSVLNQGSTYGYDEFNRLTARTVNSGAGPNYGWVYDIYGNRWQQNGVHSSQLSFNTANNQINTAGYQYDAAGNMTNDGFHTYTYDAEGNITAVDGGTTAQYVYNAQNQRVRATVGSTAIEYVFNAAGQRVSEWNGTTRAQLKGKYYWGGKPVAYYTTASDTNAAVGAHFEHQDWLGTERLRTTYNGGVEGSYISLPFGDGFSTFSGTDADANHYATLDHDAESGTDHAEFRQYSEAQGRWLSPDPYDGSYDASNPQSFNRYVYSLNNPMSYIDPSGMVDTQAGNICSALGASANETICAVQETNTGAGDGYGYGSDYGSFDFDSIGAYAANTPNCDTNKGGGCTITCDPSGNCYICDNKGVCDPPITASVYVPSGPYPTLPLVTIGFPGIGGGSANSGGPGGGRAPNNGGDYNGNSPNYLKRKPTGQCATILNNYLSSADKVNGKAWVNFWGPTMTGAAAGGGGLLTMGKALLVGILNGAAWSFTDDSRAQINSLYNSANAQWQGAGCGSSMYNKYD